MSSSAFAPASSLRSLSPKDFPAEQLSRWIGASERKAQTEATVEPEDVRPGDGDTAQWFVAVSDPRRETSVARTLRRRAYRTYVPTMRVSRTVHRKRITAGSPVFPRYVFVGLDAGQTFYGMRDTPGLGGLVKNHGAPVLVTHEMIQGIRVMEGNGTWDFTDEADRARAEAAAAKTEAEERAKREAVYVAGREVVITDGPFLNFTGTVIELLPGDRISVWISLFGRASMAPLPLASVRPR
ncbi:transcription termination/antitermination protein NusG [Methylobacterium sp.]|uniref:transcription termination/antitermination protein NusG n=1 Tax=Methylobacterium sp. TaxID=409 RepID=UPI003B59CA27